MSERPDNLRATVTELREVTKRHQVKMPSVEDHLAEDRREGVSIREEMEALLSRSGLASDPTLRTFVLALASACGRIEDVGATVAEQGAAVAEAKASPPSVLSEKQWNLLLKAVRADVRAVMRESTCEAILAAKLQFMVLGGVAAVVLLGVGVLLGRFWF